jgi:nucleotide-binding universal stress UspA family protein
VDRFADLQAYDHIFAGLNIQVQKEYFQQIRDANDKKLATQLKEVDADFDELKFETLAGDPAEELIEYAKKPEIDFIVIGNENLDFVDRVFAGSVGEKVIHNSEKSVLIVKDGEFKRPKQIMVPFDFSEHCYHALDKAIELAKLNEGKVRLVNIISCSYDGFYLTNTLKNGLTEAMQEVIQKAQVDLNQKFSHLIEEKGIGEFTQYDIVLDHEGCISDTLIKTAGTHQCDFIVMGSHKRGLIARAFLGSVSHSMVSKSKVPLLIVK